MIVKKPDSNSPQNFISEIEEIQLYAKAKESITIIDETNFSFKIDYFAKRNYEFKIIPPPIFE